MSDRPLLSPSTRRACVSSEHSRPLRLAGRAANAQESELRERFEAASVQVSTASAQWEHVETAALLLETLRRLPIQLTLDPQGLPRSRVEAIVDKLGDIDPARALAVSGVRRHDAYRVHVGASQANADLVAVPDRHGAHIGAPDVSVLQGTGVSGLGVATTAALAAGEVFKQAAGVLPSRGRPHHRLSWCPVALSDRPGDTPPLDLQSPLALAFVGLGAIGSAAVRIMDLLPFEGTAILVDPERYGLENVGTYSLGGPADAEAEVWKTDLAATALTNFSTHTHAEQVERVIERVDAGEVPWPRTVISGLDSALGRREVQRLWPDRLLDGATGDTSCGLHDYSALRIGACLRCLFPVETSGPSSLQPLAAATGLAPDVLRYGDQPLREEHLAGLAPHERGSLEGELGKPICGLARAVGLTDLPDDGYQPSVPFVSQQAACLVLGRLVADQLGLPEGATFVQYDSLLGPHLRAADNRQPLEGCFCQERHSVVQALRERRRDNVLTAR